MSDSGQHVCITVIQWCPQHLPAGWCLCCILSDCSRSGGHKRGVVGCHSIKILKLYVWQYPFGAWCYCLLFGQQAPRNPSVTWVMSDNFLKCLTIKQLFHRKVRLVGDFQHKMIDQRVTNIFSWSLVNNAATYHHLLGFLNFNFACIF